MIPEDIVLKAQARFLKQPSSQNPSQLVTSTYDLPLKRNLALVLARKWGAQRICLLDDDITISVRQIQVGATALSDKCPLAGYFVFDFPDVSTIDHIERILTGVPSQTMPGGNALFLYLPQTNGFFPYIYNEDWIFVLQNGRHRPGAAALGEVMQSPHTPWTDTVRVRFEEFGETFITGLMQADHTLASEDLISETFWETVIRERQQYLASLHSSTGDRTYRAALHAANGELASFSARTCAQFAGALRCESGESLWHTLRLL